MRHGGVSTGNFSSLNPAIYTADDPARVRRNLELLAEAINLVAEREILAPERIIMAHQTHDDRSLIIDGSFLACPAEERKERLEGVDALITALPGVCVSVATADCVPVLLYAPDRGVVAAVHAGWRGTVAMIAQKTALRMRAEFGCDLARMRAGIGPSIGPDAFEVGEEVVDAFRAAGFPGRVFRRNAVSGKAHIDLWEANRAQLLDAGLLAEHMEVAGICTYTRHEDYFSARRLGIRSGRLLSGIFRWPACGESAINR